MGRHVLTGKGTCLDGVTGQRISHWFVASKWVY
jgi:hypothetical protein